MRVLLVDDEENLLIVLADQLSSKGWDVSSTSNPEEALTLVYEVAPDIVITDLRMEKMNGILLTQKLRSIAPSIPVIVLTAYGEVKTAVEAIKAGAVDYLTKPVNEEELLISLGRACAERAQARENLYLRNEVNSRLGYGSFIGSSDDAQEIRSKIARAALSDAPVVLQGESGVGKELVARLIHNQSSRAGSPFLTVHCREHSEDYLLEELFGRSVQPQMFVQSKMEMAHGGSILLEDLPALPTELQNLLVHTLHTGIVEPGGNRRAFRVNVRFFVTSSEDLQNVVAEGRLLQDLFHSVNVLNFSIPSLSQRQSDIPELVQYYIQQNWTNQQSGQATKFISEPALQVLQKYDWPGNVRELYATLEGARVMSIDGIVKVSDLPSELVQQSKVGQKSSAFLGLRDKLMAEERRLIVQALERNSFIQFRAAKALGISRSLLNQKIKRLGIELPTTKDEEV